MKTLYSVFLALCCASCTPHQQPEDFHALFTKFPQLASPVKNDTVSYKLVRTVSTSKDVIIKLWQASNREHEKYQVVTIINPQGQKAHIPLLPNKFQHYWQFQHLADSTKSNTGPSFEHELKKSIESLGLNDTLGTAGHVLDEVFLSLLHCRMVQECDSNDISGQERTKALRRSSEPDDSCAMMMTKNWQMIHRELHPSTHMFRFLSYMDERNGRIYQVTPIKWQKNKKLDYEVKVYKRYCDVGIIIL